MVIFHSYASLPEGNMRVRQASGTLPATTYKVVTPRSTSGFTPLSIRSDSHRYNQKKTSVHHHAISSNLAMAL